MAAAGAGRGVGRGAGRHDLRRDGDAEPGHAHRVLGMAPESVDEDCLFLNVRTPALDDARRPVMVWIHGGAFIFGSGSSPLYDGVPFVDGGDVVLVTINYRLGAFGFLDLGWLDDDFAGSGNLGLMDQVAALEWVRDNIAGFGGDPDNVTIFGESAGGMSVTSLLAAEPAKGRFHKAIAQSGAAQSVATPTQAENSARVVIDGLGVSTADELRALTAEQVLAVQSQVMVEAFTNPEPLLEEGVSAGLPFRPSPTVTSCRHRCSPPSEAGAPRVCR